MPISPQQFANSLYNNLTKTSAEKAGKIKYALKHGEMSKQAAEAERKKMAFYGDAQMQTCVSQTIKDLIKKEQEISGLKFKAGKIKFAPSITQPRRSLFVQAAQEIRKKNGIVINFVGESHDSVSDHKRTEELLRRVEAGKIKPTMILQERGLRYHTVMHNTVTEEVISTVTHAFGSLCFGTYIEEGPRSWLLAGYMVAALATGDQLSQEHIVVLCGDRHADILEKVEYLIADAAPHLQSRFREQLHYGSTICPSTQQRTHSLKS